ncbi:hypothetical protein [Alkalibacterium sp. 20]|uniref:hypothetical protein n=1 Tax=Alkalibacterium sp. 20 TaxID=1798803 RepID=UPI000A57BE5E|nr:hypothetical protein [Alkalibacterium sp. 20]
MPISQNSRSVWLGGFASAQWLPGIPPLNGIIGAMILFIGLSKLTEKVWASKQASLGEEVY